MAYTSSTTRTKNVHGRYGFAKLDNDIFLVQLDSSPAPRTYQVHVFRHDFVSVFPYLRTQVISSELLEILDNDENGAPRCWLEEDTATVFVAQDVMSRFIRLKDMLVPRMGVWRPSTRRPDRRSIDGRSFRSGLAAV